MPILKEELDALSKYGVLKTEMLEVITGNLNPAFSLAGSARVSGVRHSGGDPQRCGP